LSLVRNFDLLYVLLLLTLLFSAEYCSLQHQASLSAPIQPGAKTTWLAILVAFRKQAKVDLVTNVYSLASVDSLLSNYYKGFPELDNIYLLTVWLCLMELCRICILEVVMPQMVCLHVLSISMCAMQVLITSFYRRMPPPRSARPSAA